MKERDISDKVYSARRLPDKIHYRILRCKRCSLVFSSPILSYVKLQSLYRESVCNYKDQIPYLIKTYFKIIEQVKNSLPKNPKVLEVGCGNGFFLKSLMDIKFTNNVFGVEPSLKMVAEADSSLKNKIKVNLFGSSLFPDNSFDLILCFHTLDHMIDPDKFISESFSLLKKGGIVIAVVHDVDGLSVKLFGERSPIFDVEHIYLFNKKTLKDIFKKNRFEVAKVFNVVNAYPLSYWIKMSGSPFFIKKVADYIVNLVGIERLSLSIPAGNIGIIARKK